MKITMLGGTSHVASELCLILRQWNHRIRPTSRSRVSSSFLNDQDFNPVIGDITNRETMREAVDDADVIVIAAFARQYSKGFAPKKAHRTNVSIVKNAVKEAPKNASLIYFSTIAIYSEATGFSRFDSYATEKRRIERRFLKACSENDVDGYVFRMGPVYGQNQGNQHNLQKEISKREKYGEVHVNIGREQLSNVVHTVTIADAITKVHTKDQEGKIFTVVNQPQWTWGDVFEEYSQSGTDMVFHPRERGSSNGYLRRLVSSATNTLESNERALRSLTVYLPERVNERIFNEYIKRKASANLGTFDQRNRIELSQFDQKSAPGNRIAGLTETAELLSETGEIQSLTEGERIETRSAGSIVQF